MGGGGKNEENWLNLAKISMKIKEMVTILWACNFPQLSTKYSHTLRR